MLLGLQVNIVAGVGMLIFGGSFLYLARKGTPTVRSLERVGRRPRDRRPRAPHGARRALSGRGGRAAALRRLTGT